MALSLKAESLSVIWLGLSPTRAGNDSRPGPRGAPRHELVGGIAIMQDDDPAAEKILASRPSLHTIVFVEGEVHGGLPHPGVPVLAGEPTTRTVVTEHGHHFTVDLAGVYFSARAADRAAAHPCPGA